MKASQNGHEIVVRWLVTNSKKIELQLDAKNNFGQTAITLAKKYGHEKIVKLLTSIT